MKRRRRVIVEIATSADGYIARLDGDVSWLDRPQPKGHYGMGAFVKSIDTILCGRKTYTKGIEMGSAASSVRTSSRWSTSPSRVLIVDDNYSVRQVLGEIFRREVDFDICGEAANGDEAIGAAKLLNPDLIILDLAMPVMNGLAAASRHCAIPPPFFPTRR
jgi:hypothetical protein